MIKTINRLAILDLLVIILGLCILFVKPFGLDISHGIIAIAVGFFFAIILFLLKLKITSNNV